MQQISEKCDFYASLLLFPNLRLCFNYPGETELSATVQGGGGSPSSQLLSNRKEGLS